MSTSNVAPTGPVVQARVPPELVRAIRVALRSDSNGGVAETQAEFVREALWNECHRRGQSRQVPAVSFSDIVKRLDLLALEVQKLRNGTTEQLTLTRQIAAELIS